jgi:hypothetical protein
MTYRTLAWVMALICGLAVPAGGATLAGGFFDVPIFQPGAYAKLVSLKAKTRGVVARNIKVKAAVQAGAMQDADMADSKGGGINIVDNALLVSVNGNEVVNTGLEQGMTYQKTTFSASNHSYNNFTGVSNVNMVAGNMNTQTTIYSGPDLSASGLLANGGTTKLTAVNK